MNKKEAIELLIDTKRFKPDSDFEKFSRPIRDKHFIDGHAATHEEVDLLEATILYEYLVEKGIINVTEIKKTIDTDKILIVESGSVDKEKLEEQSFTVIEYRQGSTPPTWLK